MYFSTALTAAIFIVILAPGARALPPPTADEKSFHESWSIRAEETLKNQKAASSRAEKIKVVEKFYNEILNELKSTRRSLTEAQEENPSVEEKVDRFDRRETELIHWKVAFEDVHDFTAKLKGQAPNQKKCDDLLFQIRLGELVHAPEDQKLSVYADLASQSVADICASVETSTGGTSRTVTPAQPVSVPGGSI